MEKARILAVASAALCAASLRAAVPGAPSQTWWGVINDHLIVRFVNDGGVTKTYRAYVKHPGESSFSLLGDVACTGGKGAQIVSLPVDGARAATFRLCRVNDDGEGAMDADLDYTATNAVLGTLISSAPYNSAAENKLANAADGDYATSFNSKAENVTWIGVDLGGVRSVTGVRFLTRWDRTYRMTNAVVQVANDADFSDATTVYTHAVPKAYEFTKDGIITLSFDAPANGRYVRWLGHDASKYLSVAEIEFLSSAIPSDEAIPSDVVPSDVTATSDALLSGGAPTVGWTDASSGAFPVQVFRATAAGGPYELVAGLDAGTTSWTDATAALGVRYYYVVQYTNTVSVGTASEWAAYRRLRRLERTAEDNTKLKDGVTVRLSNTGNENTINWKSANAFDGDTSTSVSCQVPDTRIALDFGESKVGVALVRAHAAPSPRYDRLQTACVYATDGDYLTTGVQVSDGVMPFSTGWVTLACSDPACYKVYYLMRPDHVNFYSCMAELEMYGWYPADEAAILLAPTRLTKTVTASAVTLAWDACNRAATYRVEKLVGGTWSALGTTVSPAFVDETVSLDGTSVSYRIVSVAADGVEEAISQTFSFVPYVPADGTGLTAVYTRPYTNDAWSASEETVAVTNMDAAIDHDWQRTALFPGWGTGIADIHYVRVRWYGKLVVPHAGRYSFKAETLDDNAVAVAIDGVWAVNAAHATDDGVSGELDLTAGEHDFYAEFSKPYVAAKFVLKWGGAVAEEVIPSSQFRPAAPFDYGDWTSVRTFGDVPQTGMVFPSADGASFRFNPGSRALASIAQKYLAMSRAVDGDFDLAFHAALLSPSEPNAQRFGIKVASSLDLTAPGAFYFFGYSASDNGSGWTFSFLRDAPGTGYAFPNGSAWLRRGEFLRGGAGDVRIRRKGDTITCFYKDPQTSQWVVDYTLSAAFLPQTVQLQLFATGNNVQSADVIWEISDITLDRVSGMTIIIR